MFPLNEKNFVPVTTKEFTAIKNVLCGGDYTKHVDANMALLAERRSGRSLPNSALTKIRGELLVLRAMEASRKFPSVSAQVVHRYENLGEDIYSISSSFGQPAMACFRAVLKSRGLSDASVKLGTQGNTNILNTQRDREQQALAAKHDHATTAHEDNSVPASLLFEAEIKSFLDHHGIAYKTQNELTQPGKLTPDFLLTKPVKFGSNHHEVWWIDAKDFFGGATPFMTKKTKAQATKYIDAFGPGAMIYSRGLTQQHLTDLPVKCLAMDFRWLGFNAAQQPAAAAAPEAKKPRLTTEQQPAEVTLWDSVLKALSSGCYSAQVDAAQAKAINSRLAAQQETYTVQELNTLRYDLLHFRSQETIPSRATQKKLCERWQHKNEDLFQLCKEYDLPAHVALQYIYELVDKSTSTWNQAKFDAVRKQVEIRDWLTVPKPIDPFVNRVSDFLNQAGVGFARHAELRNALVIHEGFSLQVENRPIKWLLCSNSMGGSVPNLKPLRRDVDAMRKALGGHGAVVFALGVVPGFTLFGNTAELVIDFRDLEVEQ